MGKQKKARKHVILFLPVIGPILGIIITFLLCQGIGDNIIDRLIRLALHKEYADDACLEFSLALGGILILFLYHLWFKNEFKGCYSGNWGDRKTKLLILLAAVIDLVIFGISFSQSDVHAPGLWGISLASAAAISEELAFRLVPISLVMRRPDDKRNIWLALILSSVSFGLVHGVNFLMGQTSISTIEQVFGAFGMGLLFGAIYLRTGNLLIPMIYHFLYDVLGSAQAAYSSSAIVTSDSDFSVAEVVIKAIIVIVYFVISVLIIKGNTKEISDLWKDRWNLS